MVASDSPAVRLIANVENVGFTRGNNQGLAVARGRHVFFLNPDTEVVGDALVTMVAYLDAYPEVGALGPQLRYGDGGLQSSRRRFPTFATALLESTPLAWHWPGNPWARRYRMEDQGSGIRDQGSGVTPTVRGRARGVLIGQEVDWVVGAALLVRREILKQIGGFDEGYFMYSEELDLCRRIKEAGWRSSTCRSHRSSTTRANRASRSSRPDISASKPAKYATSVSFTARSRLRR